MSDDYTDGYIYVAYSHMNNGSDDLITQTQAIAQTISSLEMEIAQLKQSWEGDDSDTYTQKQQAWDNAVHSMENMLTSHAQLLNDIGDQYKRTENQLSQMWSEVKIG